MVYNFEQKNVFNLKKHSAVKKPIATIVIYCVDKNINKIKRTIESVSNQTQENIEIIVLGNKMSEIEEFIKKDSRIKMLHLERKKIVDLLPIISNKSQYFTIIESGEEIHDTYIETSIIALELNKEHVMTYTDTANYHNKRAYNYLFDKHVVYDLSLPVPNLVFTRELLNEVKNIPIKKMKTWKVTSILINQYKAVHQSYYGFITYKVSSDLNNENKEYFERLLYQADTMNYPKEDYYYEIMDSHLDQLSIVKNPKTKTNILMIIPWMVIGGADRFNLEFVKLIDSEKYDVTILTDHPKEYIWRQEFEKHVKSLFEMPSFLDRKNWPTFISYVIETRNIDLILITNSVTGYNFVPYLKLNYPKLPIIDYIHCVELYNRYGGYGRDSSRMGSLISKTFFCSKAEEEMYKRVFSDSSRKTKTIYIGVDSDKFSPSENERQEVLEKYHLKDTINIGYICRIDYQKRPFLLAEIMKETIAHNDKIKFIIGGDGPLLKDLKNKVKEYELEDKVLFLGNVEDTVSFYSMCDMTINCSIKEGLALTSYESLSMGVPIVSADVGGQKELISSDCGVIVPLLQKEEEIMNFDYSNEEIMLYVNGIDKIIHHLEEYKENSRQKIIRKFSLNTMIDNMEKEIDFVIHNPDKRIIKDATILSNYKELVYEYLNHYLMASQYEYQTLINKYYNSFPKVEISTKKEQICHKRMIIRALKMLLFPIRFLVMKIKKHRMTGGLE